MGSGERQDLTRGDSSLRSYRELRVWQVGMDLSVDVYGLTKKLPADERFGLISQMRRAAYSIPANIAEGQGRSSTKEFLRHISIAIGSLKELETFFILSRRLDYLSGEDVNRLLSIAEEESRMLRGLQASLKRRLKR